MLKIGIEVFWDPLCIAEQDGKKGVGCYKARLENHYNCLGMGKTRLEAMQNLLLKCANLPWDYVSI
jgi:hypothetical protein